MLVWQFVWALTVTTAPAAAIATVQIDLALNLLLPHKQFVGLELSLAAKPKSLRTADNCMQNMFRCGNVGF